MGLLYLLRQIKYNRHRGARWSDVRYYLRWSKALRPGRDTLSERTAWLTFPAVDRLHQLVKPDYRVFEYGGGGSTLFWLDRVAEVVTVEHDPQWYAVLQERMQQEGGTRWTGIHEPARPGNLVPVPDPAVPEHHASADPASQGMNYRDYVHSVDRYPDGYFDVLLIDGRARTSCLAYATSKLKQGGILVLDNAERTYYTERNGHVLAGFDTLLAGMAPVIFNRDLSETRIFRKR